MPELYLHNQAAYRAAEQMLKETGKAAVIHPTGTGKSFIAFRLCTDHPEKTVCWLSPSAYIFKTQLENWEDSGAAVPENIRFFTYARLTNLTEPELLKICPDYIILDEFHRCGAKMWGQGVQRLLKCFPRAAVLGLSATGIRYLDNQRDMAAELFDGNIASELTLGEAIVRGILKAPRYVLSAYAYQGDLARYARRAGEARTQAVRETARKQIEALRRALQRSEGLSDVFFRHMNERHGKYIVFCANVAHMQRMLKKVPEWFSRVDPAPHVYTACSDDPESSASFDRFKGDASAHLKLLFCIDMLNEGIHVADVSGVILLRPTVSPIVYKQQIGRALAANQRNDAVIFDIVMNIENLWSIGALEEEMELAMTYYRARGREDLICQGPFQIIDEVRDCRRLFADLQETLSASWDLMYRQAKAYYDRRGDLSVHRGYRTEAGYPLGQWVQTQRRVRAGQVYGALTPERIAALDAIGMVWTNRRDTAWERQLQAAREYAQRHGNLKVPARYVTPEGIPLGKWLSNLRTYRKNAAQRHYLTPERIAALDALGMIWDVPDYLWQQYYGACLSYQRAHGDLSVPASYVTEEGLRLGVWLERARRRGGGGAALTQEQMQALEALGLSCRRRSDEQWERGYEAALAYYKARGDLNVPSTYQTPEGFRLGRWISRQRRREDLTASQQSRLDRLGMVWKKEDPWSLRLALAREYRRTHGHLDAPADYVTEGIWLGKWLEEQRQIYLGNRPGKALTEKQVKALSDAGMCWEGRQSRLWQEQYRQARAYFETHGSLSVPPHYIAGNGKRLDVWVRRQRRAKRQGTLSPEQVRRLEGIGL